MEAVVLAYAMYLPLTLKSQPLKNHQGFSPSSA